MLNILISSKSDDEIQTELLDLVGYHNFSLLEQLLARREAIRASCASLNEKLKAETNVSAAVIKNPNGYFAGPPRGGVTITMQTGDKKNRKKRKQEFDANAWDREKKTNYDLLRKLGFGDELLGPSSGMGQPKKPPSRRWTIIDKYRLGDEPAS